MTDTELVTAGSKFYGQILAIPFGHEEMLALGEAALGRTPWGALTPAAKIATFRLADAILPAETELVTAGRRLYQQILAVPFGRDEMLEFGQAVFSKTPWSALTPAAKLGMFRLTAALTPPSEPTVAAGAIPDAEIVDRAEESPVEPEPPAEVADGTADSESGGAIDDGADAAFVGSNASADDVTTNEGQKE